MLDPAITSFFDQRKEAWLKKNSQSSMDEGELNTLKQECEQVFSPNEWLPNAAKRAGQISMATHPCTFSHPSARKNKNGYVTSVIARAERKEDGFLRSGNVDVETDALGNAAALDVYKFLTLNMADGQPLLAHITRDSELAVELLKIETASYKDLKQGFMAMSESSGENTTSSKIKQVYFPVEVGYQQLSILTNSGMVYQLRKRIDDIRFSEQSKNIRELKKKEEYSEQGFMELYGLTTIGYGGTKPQNISVLNNQNGGKAHLLSSLPPTVNKRNIHFPKTNFFTESFRYYECRDSFQALHKLLKADHNNIKIREGRDRRLQEIVDRIVDRMWAVRAAAAEQFHVESSRLRKHQLIWLAEEFKEERENSDQWLETLCKEVASWLILSYEKMLGKQAIKLGEAERLHILTTVKESQEALR